MIVVHEVIDYFPIKLVIYTMLQLLRWELADSAIYKPINFACRSKSETAQRTSSKVPVATILPSAK